MKPASFTPDELFKHCRPAGVDRIGLIQMSFYGFDNKYMLDMIALYEGELVGTAVIDPAGRGAGPPLADPGPQKGGGLPHLPRPGAGVQAHAGPGGGRPT